MTDRALDVDDPSAEQTETGQEFFRASGVQIHAVRAKAVLASHPEVRALIGRNPWTGAICLALVAFQIGMATLLSHVGWRPTIVALALAFAVGAFVNHSLYVIMHDAAHDLVFRRRFANKLLALAADLPNLMPGAIAFRTYHLAHHAHLGEEKRDPDLPAVWERRLFGRSTLGKALWVALFPLMQALRSLEVGGEKLRDPWFAANIAANLAFVVTIGLTLGWTALIYLFFSCWFGLGPHPLGARWIQEHFTLDPAQETTSYYGVLNRIAFNIGYHNEHHDFPSVPWNRLPAVTGTAPEFYGALTACRSWPGLLLTFICDRRYSLGSRIARF